MAARSDRNSYDINDTEKSASPPYDEKRHSIVAVEEAGVAHQIQEKTNFLRRLRAGEEWLNAKMGIELQGIDRIPEDEKRPPSIINIFFLWWSLNVHVGVIALGTLGPAFGLSLRSSIVAAIIGNLIGCSLPAYTGTLGPRLGLRAVCTSRYSFGFWGAKICSILNVVIGGGFGVVNYVVVGEILNAVSNYTISITVGIVIIAIMSYLISVFGFRIIHTFEKYSWIASFILFLVLIGQAAPHIDGSVPNAVSGISYTGSFLTILAINFSNSSAWDSIASDYYVNYPAKTSSLKIFCLTYFGIFIPVNFSVVIGSCIANAAQVYPPYKEAYSVHLLGGLIREIYHPEAWSKFCLVILTFSVLGNNIAINYSSGLSLQLLGHYFHAVPRLVWSLAFAIVVAVLAIAGQQSLSSIISNFVSLLGYWAVSFALILLMEDRIFRMPRKGEVSRREDPAAGYDLTVWDKPEGLPWGIAAVFALLCGYLAGGLPGASQTWFVGPLAKDIGGGDIGNFLSAAYTVIVYLPARYLEKKWTGR